MADAGEAVQAPAETPAVEAAAAPAEQESSAHETPASADPADPPAAPAADTAAPAAPANEEPSNPTDSLDPTGATPEASTTAAASDTATDVAPPTQPVSDVAPAVENSADVPTVTETAPVEAAAPDSTNVSTAAEATAPEPTAVATAPVEAAAPNSTNVSTAAEAAAPEPAAVAQTPEMAEPSEPAAAQLEAAGPASSEGPKKDPDMSYIDSRTKDLDRLSSRRSLTGDKLTGAGGAGDVSGLGTATCQKDSEGKWQVDTSYINTRTQEVDRLEGRRNTGGASVSMTGGIVHSSSVKKEGEGKWKVDTSYIQNRTADKDNLVRKMEEAEKSNFADPATKKHSLEALRDKENRPTDVDPAIKEQYLSDEEFQAVFGMTNEEFGKLQKWKRDKLKKEKDLF